jgi:hypothetical protein
MMRHRPDLCVGRTTAGGTTALSDALEYRAAKSTPTIEQASREMARDLRNQPEAWLSSATPHKMSCSDTSTASSPNAPSTS